MSRRSCPEAIHQKIFKTIGLVIPLLLTLQIAFASTDPCRVTITVLGDNQMELLGIYVEIPEIDQKGVTDINGEVIFFLEQGKSYVIHLHSGGFEEQQLTLQIPAEDQLDTTIQLKLAVRSLEEVVISGQSQEMAVRELPFKPQVISLGSIRAQPAPVTALLNQLPGVRIRQEGGAGSDANVMLNGIDGKGVKVFLDGVPVYLLGGGYSLNTLSPSIIERIEVYKGTIPVAFGSDALGGVINVVSRYQQAEYAEVSYSYGSWNTHEASLNARKKFGPDGKCFVQVDGFYTYSDNDYWMDEVEVLVPNDPNNNTELGRARRFNDQFSSVLTRLKAGIRDVKWADELMLMASYSHIDREWQHGLRAEVPWGEPTSSQDSRNLSFSWKKYDKLDKWTASVVAGFTHDQLSFVDTARKTYFWDQHFTPKTNGGETSLYSNGTAPVLTTRAWFSRESFSYSLNEHHTLNFTALFTNDEVNIRNEVLPEEDQERLQLAQTLLKNYAGLSLASKLLDGKLTNTASAKHFYTRSSGVNFDNRTVGERETNEFSIFGYGDVIQYRLGDQLTMNFGYEFTVRQPDDEEIFGNYLTVAPNPALSPEKSHNLNLGTEFSTRNNRATVGATAFYRNTSDRIFLNAVTFGLARFENLLGTRGIGAELHANYLIIKGLRASANATYQDITLRETSPQANIPDRYLRARVPNIPYLFGNGQLSYSTKVKGLGNGRITAAYDISYVHDFFLSWAEDGRAETKDVIPTQVLHNLNVSWMAPKERWSIGIEGRNLTDARAFDNFSVQRPGRSFFVKLRLFVGT